MMRMIDAEALAQEILETYGDVVKPTEVNEVVDEIYGMVINAPTIGGWVPCSEKSCDMKDCPYRTEYDWIPVTERLPEEYAQYLVCDEDGECFVYWLEDAYWARRDIEQEHIVAWMPLPEPYEAS